MGKANSLWVEKYRPRTVDDIAHQVEVVKMLKRVLECGNMPHLLFYGPPGTGKTSAVLALARELFGPDEYKSRTLELNASDERGIDVVREKIKSWTRQVVTIGKENPITKRKLPSWKIVILDEAELMTNDAQSALRRIIEVSSKNTRFVIICNYINMIIEPLASRCAKFRFQPISLAAQRTRLMHVCAGENIDIDSSAVDVLIDISGGDLRRAITFLQSASHLYNNKVTAEIIKDISGVPNDGVMEKLVNICSHEDLDGVEKTVSEIISEGWDVTQLLRSFCTRTIYSNSIEDGSKALLALRFAECDVNFAERANEYLNLLNICSHYHHTLGGKKECSATN